MGTCLIAFREVYQDGKWLCCEKQGKDGILEDCDCMQFSSMFSVLAGIRGEASSIFLDYPNGLPEDLSKTMKKYVEDRESKDIETYEKWYTEGSGLTLNSVKTQWYNTTIQDILDFIFQLREDIIDTGYLPEDLIDDNALEKLERFRAGLYADDKEKAMNLYLKLYDSRNYLKLFVDSLNDKQCDGEYIGKFSEVPNDLKRVMFYFS